MNRSSIAEACRIALRRGVVLRATRVGLLVGCLLIAINQGDVLLAGSLDTRTWLKVLLTPVVPYLVSTFSSVAAIREHEALGPSGL